MAFWPFDTRRRGGEGKQRTASPTAKANEERVVPIRLTDSGRTVMPQFTKLEDITLPEWSAFSPKHKSAQKKAEEKMVPISVEEERVTTTETMTEETVTPTTSPSRETSPASSRTTTTTTERRSREKTTKTSEKRVQHTVRFVDEDEEDAAGRKSSIAKEAHDAADGMIERRSSSLDARRKTPSPEQTASVPSSTRRTRHRSGGHAGHGSGPERTLNEIDRDIHKIWNELQQLDALPSASAAAARPPLAGIPRRGSPARGVVATSSGVTATPTTTASGLTPVKVRTFTTPSPSMVVPNGHSVVNQRRSAPLSSSVPTSSVEAEVHNRRLTTSRPPYSPPPRPISASTPLTYRPYNPRRDLEPTRPGAITPAYSSSVPSAVIFKNGNSPMKKSTAAPAANGGASQNGSLSPTVSQRYAAKTRDFERNNNSNGGGPKTEARNAVAAVAEKRRSSAFDEAEKRPSAELAERNGGQVAVGLNGGTTTLGASSSPASTSGVDKACQTEKRDKRGRGRCSLQ